jgi:asparagine synthase (glutamine-hydrolysing)
MCGIAGVYSPTRCMNAAAVTPMLAAMSHRGPDDSGVEVLSNGELVFGHLRLSILDLSPLGHQPMTTADRKAWIVYNGEIYNFRQLRAELISCNWKFRSDSDSEVILAALLHWGPDAVRRFHGMFAFAFWNELTKTLYICRDRFGVKPLYYSITNGVFAFASELKGLMAGRFTRKAIDAVSVAEFLQYGYTSAPRSIFADVRVVRPGTICTIDSSLGIREHEYWSVRDIFDGHEAVSLREELSRMPDEGVLERAESSLQKAFEYRMVADVPVGVFLSGGIDSSLVAAILVRRSGFGLRTFTIGYGASEFDETRYASQVAKALGSEHTELIVSPKAALDAASELPEIADEPIGDSSLIPTLMVSRLARAHVKVALSADGADELFGGYTRYKYCERFLRGRSRFVRALYYLSGDMLEQLPPKLLSIGYSLTRRRGTKFAAISDKLRKFIRMTKAADDFGAYEAAISEWSTDQRRRLLSNSPETAEEARSTFDSVQGGDLCDRFMHFDIARYLPGDLLTKVDRASMHVSLEAREPFLDHETAALAAALPMRWKIGGGKGKVLLRRLLARHFPQELFDRPKQGFSAPIESWLKGPLRESFVVELASSRIRQIGILDPVAVGEATRSFLSPSNRNVSPAGAWTLLQFQQWAQRWLAEQPSNLKSACRV